MAGGMSQSKYLELIQTWISHHEGEKDGLERGQLYKLKFETQWSLCQCNIAARESVDAVCKFGSACCSETGKPRAYTVNHSLRRHKEALANLEVFSFVLVPKWIYSSNFFIMSDLLAFSICLIPQYFTRISMYSGRKMVNVVVQRVCDRVKKRIQIQIVSSMLPPWGRFHQQASVSKIVSWHSERSNNDRSSTTEEA